MAWFLSKLFTEMRGKKAGIGLQVIASDCRLTCGLTCGLTMLDLREAFARSTLTQTQTQTQTVHWYLGTKSRYLG
jgi:hypothetical protein